MGEEDDGPARQGAWRIKRRKVIADSDLPESYMATYEPRMNYDIDADQ